MHRALSISAVAVCLVLAILLTTVYVNRPTEIQMPDEALLAEIKEDYYCIFRNTNDYDPEKSVQMTCYGIYSGCVIGFLSLSDAPILPASSYEEVADVYFNYNTVTSMSVWKDGYFYSLREAYDRGYLSKKDIYALADQFYKGKEDTREHTEFYNNYRKD